MDMENLMDRDFLKISKEWSKIVDHNEGENDDDDRTSIINGDDSISLLIDTLNSDCARLEVNAIEMLALLENEREKNDGNSNDELTHSNANICLADENDDDGLEDEIMYLENVDISTCHELKILESAIYSKDERPRINEQNSRLMSIDTNGFRIQHALCA